MRIYSLQRIETPRTILRPLEIGDEIELNKLINHSLESLQKWMPWAQDSRLPTTRNFVYESVANWKSKTGNNYPMVVISKSNKKIIGASGFNEESIVSKGIYTTGYWLDIAYRGQGLVTEFVNGLTRYAFDHLQAKAVYIRADKANTKSIAVANRLGFIPTPNIYQESIDENKSNASIKDETLLFTRNNTSLLPPLDVSWYE
jgi:RimJ/RimL family protein N-acetyltransferase